MRRVTVSVAKAQLSQLIRAALAGEDVVILKGSKPVVRLVAIPQMKFRMGLMKDRLGEAPDFLTPLDDSELDLWEGRSAEVASSPAERDFWDEARRLRDQTAERSLPDSAEIIREDREPR